MRPVITQLLLLCFTTTFFSQSLNYYFGNLHSHTAFSDGNKDSVNSLIKTPLQSYAFAKLSEDFDFLGISEHNHYNSARNPGFRRPRYQEGLSMADAANDDGNFLTLFGMEYGVSSNYHGHVIIYGYNKLLGWEPSVPNMTGKNYEVYNAKGDYDSLFRKIKNTPGAFCYLAHPDFDNFSSHGTSDDPLAWAPYNAAYDSAIVGMPLRSGLATSTVTSYDDYSLGNYFTYFKRLLYVGYHLGIGYDHDNHYSNFGRSNGGRLVIMTPSLSRANLYSAMQQMHFYGSDDSNVKIDFNVNGHMMGSVANGTAYPTVQLIHNDPDGEVADSIKIWKGYKNSGGLWAQIIHTSLSSNTSSYLDNDVVMDREYYYFAEIKQADGQWIVTSPIWYTKKISVGVAESGMNDFVCFPDPASEFVNLSFPVCAEYKVSMIDMTGRTVLSDQTFDQEIKISVADLKPGIYTLRIESNNSTRSKKICVIH